MPDELDFESEVTMIKKRSDASQTSNSETAVDVKEKNSESDTGEINSDDDKGPNDLEEGEIHDKPKSSCRFFKNGRCFFGSHCHYLHVSDNVYNMFNPVPSNKQRFDTFDSPQFFKPAVFNTDILQPMEIVENAWEKGLEKAKSLIQKAIHKRDDDDEFEIKKLYLSPEIHRNEFTVKTVVSKVTMDRNYQASRSKKSPRKPVTPENERRFKREDSSGGNRYRYSNRAKSNYNYQWVDPWRRSMSPKTRNRSKVRSRLVSPSKQPVSRPLSSLSSSSTSSFEHIYGSPVTSKKHSPKKGHSLKRNRRLHSFSRSVSRSYSRSPSRKKFCSRTLSKSRSSSRSRGKQIKKSYQNKLPIDPLPLRKIVIKKDISPKRFRRHTVHSPSCDRFRKSSSVHSSTCHTDDDSTSEVSISSLSCSSLSSSSETYSSERSCSTLCQKSGLQHKGKILSLQNMQNRVLPSYKPTTFGKYDKINTYSKVSSINANTKDTVPSSSQTKIAKPPMAENDNHLAGEEHSLLRYHTISQNKKYGEKPASLSTELQALDSKFNNQRVHDPGHTRIVSMAKRPITLNLQPKSKKYVHATQVQDKPLNLSQISFNAEKRASDRKEALLKQLRLVEDAIARKSSKK